MTKPAVPMGQELRPVPRLLTIYLLQALLAVPAFPFLAVYYYFRYHTLRYRFDAEGISMAWGILFRREIHLTYARIQDIHLVSHVLERFLGLARIQIQTASGKAGAEMVLEGLPDHEGVRDFLYARMRGAASPLAVDSPEAGDSTTAAFWSCAASRPLPTFPRARRPPARSSERMPPTTDCACGPGSCAKGSRLWAWWWASWSSMPCSRTQPHPGPPPWCVKRRHSSWRWRLSRC